MPLQSISLFILSVILIFGAPIYIFFRNKMVKTKTSGEDNYGQRKIFKLTSINIAIVTVSQLLLILMLIGVINYQIPQGSHLLVLFLLYILLVGLAFYGSGIYITSIVLETFTSHRLKKASDFKKQFIATELFHGPISHILIYSGVIASLLVLAILELLLDSTTPINNGLTALAIPTGILYAISQIYNHTSIYQFIASTLSLIIFSIIVLLLNVPSHMGQVGQYFLYFTATLSFTLILTYLLNFQEWSRKKWFEY